MKKIAIVFAAAGAFLAILAQYADTNEWVWASFFHTLGFIGYIFVISGLAYLSLWYIHQLSRDEKHRIRHYYHKQK
ncbi:hypothetical protein SAMN05444266_105297 [Chitinophaga jiangningensis]|uniref:Uncharacterized protein n=1 Tax=Chitinophaga jiangningensis TaxID=1419482 RepID=A0A1M7E5Y1_9BACT|nr:hypothetical protein [Chitinophaga jiangningensis]SHL87154.1 hypothetical protein SAMN05444266_105297 [Chitinophaga jiangningensis]